MDLSMTSNREMCVISAMNYNTDDPVSLQKGDLEVSSHVKQIGDQTIRPNGNLGDDQPSGSFDRNCPKRLIELPNLLHEINDLPSRNSQSTNAINSFISHPIVESVLSLITHSKPSISRQ
jgi:hypothetical protein